MRELTQEQNKELNKLKDILAQATGSEHYYKSNMFTQGIVHTDGVQELADVGQCFWVIDLICSYQHKPQIKSEEFQVWEILRTDTVHKELKAYQLQAILEARQENAEAVAVATDGNNNVLAKQIIPISSLLLPALKVYLTNNVILLPSEY